ncbi:MAG TPA: alpha/beta hydrolase [Gemmataceae bacterium]|nr:alpha/beta hydrolase [Gemmataceae bacterium]
MRTRLFAALLCCATLLTGQDKPKTEPRKEVGYERKEDVVYGRKHGLAMTMDVYTPEGDKNGAGVIFCVSGGWFSAKEAINVGLFAECLKRGYVVFAVVHGSQPRFSIPEVLDDMHRATRYIRLHSKEYGVDPDRLGVSGGSAGGHLSLMQGCAPREGDPKAKDPVERESSKVAAVACFFPPTDFLNYGKPGEEALGGGTLKGFKAPFEFVELDKDTRAYKVITDQARRREIGKQISPVNHVTAKSPPVLIVHGDKDTLVPIQQAEIFVAKMKAANAHCELRVKVGGLHGWPDMKPDLEALADWFDKYLTK